MQEQKIAICPSRITLVYFVDAPVFLLHKHSCPPDPCCSHSCDIARYLANKLLPPIRPPAAQTWFILLVSSTFPLTHSIFTNLLFFFASLRFETGFQISSSREVWYSLLTPVRTHSEYKQKRPTNCKGF